MSYANNPNPEDREPIVSAKGVVYKCVMDLPPEEQALILVIFGKCKILDYIGPKLDYLWVDGYMQNHFDEEVEALVTADGLYLWSGKVVEHTTLDGDDYETWIEGSFTQATREQWEAYVNENHPWDLSLWLVDEFVRDAVLGSCELDHSMSKHWPPDRFHREDVI